MTTWEYKTVRIPFLQFHTSTESHNKAEEDILTTMGELGWELVHIDTHLGAPAKLYFKRIKEPEPEVRQA